MTEDNNNDYQVGFGKPPKHSQFKPGQSGNPGGRPKAKKSVHQIMQEFCEELVTVNENGQKKTMTKIQVAMASLFSKASKGDVHAIKLFLTLKAEADSYSDAAASAGLSLEESEALLGEMNWLAFVQEAHAEGEEDGTE